MKHRRPSPVLDDGLTEALLDAQAPLLPAPERKQALRERILGRVRAEPRPHPIDHLTIRSEEGIWVPLLPGVSLKLLREDHRTRSYLLRMAPGARLPAHQHSQEEECMVLEGEIWLGDVHACAGDYHLAQSGLAHGVLHTEVGCLLFLRGQKTYGHLGAG